MTTDTAPLSALEELSLLELDAGELIEAHTPKAERDFTRWADDPVGFIVDELGETDPGPWSAQVETATAVREHSFVVVRGNNSAGKDWLAARLALWWALAHEGLVIVTGPTQRQVREIVFGEIARAFKPHLPGELYATQLRFGREETRGIIGVVSNTVSRLTGFHGAKVMGIMTEAQGIDAMGWEAMLACRTGEDDKSLAVGNPLSPSGPFFEASRRGHWHAIRINAEDHPNVVEGREVIRGGPSRSWMETMATEYGRGSGIYRSRVLGEFPDSGEEGLFRRVWLDDAAERWRVNVPDDRKAVIVDGVADVPPSPPQPVVALDPARYGPDSTCLAVRLGSRIDRLVTWGSKDTMETVERTVEELKGAGVRPGDRLPSNFGALPIEWQNKARETMTKPRGFVVVDSVGLGAGVGDRLAELGYRVTMYNGGAFTGSAKRSRFLNTRAESYWHLRKLLEDGKIDLPPDEMLFDELMATNWFPTTDERIQIERKADLKTRLGRSPDRADAVVMAFSLEMHRIHVTRVPSPWG